MRQVFERRFVISALCNVIFIQLLFDHC